MRGKEANGAEPFLFSCHPLKRREDSASHRERSRRAEGNDWWARGKDGMGPTIRLQERDGLADDWLQPWAARRIKQGSLDQLKLRGGAGMANHFLAGRTRAASGLPGAVHPWVQGEAALAALSATGAQPPLRRAVTQHYIKGHPPTRRIPSGIPVSVLAALLSRPSPSSSSRSRFCSLLIR